MAKWPLYVRKKLAYARAGRGTRRGKRVTDQHDAGLPTICGHVPVNRPDFDRVWCFDIPNQSAQIWKGREQRLHRRFAQPVHPCILHIAVKNKFQSAFVQIDQKKRQIPNSTFGPLGIVGQ